MKNLKKIISLTIIFTLLLTSQSFAYVQKPDKKALTNLKNPCSFTLSNLKNGKDSVAHIDNNDKYTDVKIICDGKIVQETKLDKSSGTYYFTNENMEQKSGNIKDFIRDKSNNDFSNQTKGIVIKPNENDDSPWEWIEEHYSSNYQLTGTLYRQYAYTSNTTEHDFRFDAGTAISTVISIMVGGLGSGAAYQILTAFGLTSLGNYITRNFSPKVYLKQIHYNYSVQINGEYVLYPYQVINYAETYDYESGELNETYYDTTGFAGSYDDMIDVGAQRYRQEHGWS